MFTNRMKTINPQIQEFQETLNTKNMKKTTPKHIATVLLKTNDEKKNLKAAHSIQYVHSIEYDKEDSRFLIRNNAN